MMKLTTGLLLAVFLLSLQTANSQNFEKAKKIIERANTVALETKSISYDYTYTGHGKYTGHFKGTVRLQGTYPNFSTYLVLNALDENGNQLKSTEIASSGMNIELIDHSTKEFKYGTMTGGSSHLSSYSYYAALYQYVSPKPFESELKDSTLKFEGIEKIRGVDCNVVSTSNSFGDRLFWYIGVDDHLIHANKSVHDDPNEGGGFYFEMSSIKVDQSASEENMKIAVPNDYKKIDEDNRKIEVGTEAPGWFLKNTDGISRRRLDYPNQVVVLDFWASWCKPCWSIMPIVNGIQEAYDEKEVKVFGVNVWEKKGLNLKAYMKEKGLDHYETLIDPDALTANKFKVFSLPFVVVIGKDGKIKYMTNQGTKDVKQELEAAIKQALQD